LNATEPRRQDCRKAQHDKRRDDANPREAQDLPSPAAEEQERRRERPGKGPRPEVNLADIY
jgi:hypothetical protein